MERDAFGRPIQPQPVEVPAVEQSFGLPEPKPAETIADPIAVEADVSYQSTLSAGSALTPAKLKSWEVGTRVGLSLPQQPLMDLQVTEISPHWGFEAQLAGHGGRYRLLQVEPGLLQVDVLHPEEHLRFGGVSGARAIEAIQQQQAWDQQAQFGELTVVPHSRLDLTLRLQPVDPEIQPLVGVWGGGWFAQPLGWYLRHEGGVWRAVGEREKIEGVPSTLGAKLRRAALIAVGLAALYWLFGQHPA